MPSRVKSGIIWLIQVERAVDKFGDLKVVYACVFSRPKHWFQLITIFEWQQLLCLTCS